VFKMRLSGMRIESPATGPTVDGTMDIIFPGARPFRRRGRRCPCRSGRGLAGLRTSLSILWVKRGIFMAYPAVRGASKILLDWEEKGSALVVASQAVSACCEGFSILRVFQKLGISACHCASQRAGQKSECRKFAPSDDKTI
jgi:hypothetical protein